MGPTHIDILDKFIVILINILDGNWPDTKKSSYIYSDKFRLTINVWCDDTTFLDSHIEDILKFDKKVIDRLWKSTSDGPKLIEEFIELSITREIYRTQSAIYVRCECSDYETYVRDNRNYKISKILN